MHSREEHAASGSQIRATIISIARPGMRWLSMLAAMLLACAGVILGQAGYNPAKGAATATTERYIVVLEDNVDDPAQVASGIEQRQEDLDVGVVYDNALEGFSASIPQEDLAAVRANPDVDYVEPDKRAHALYQTLPWGIDRIDAEVSSTRAGNGSGMVSNVNVYIIDSGIDKTHPDLNVVRHVNFTNGKNTDCDGHGTHVAGTVAAKDDLTDVVGAAPGAPLTGVKVLGCNGSGWDSNIIKGIDWVTAHAQKPAVANMSIGGRASKALDDAVRKSANRGIFYAVAAGNESTDACTVSPARAGAGTNNGIMTVAATDWGEQEAYFSNYGRCVDIWAPGVSIPSTRLGGGTTTMSGTSMASPHVAGGAALYLSRNTVLGTPLVSAPVVESQLKLDAEATGTQSKDGRPIQRLYVGRY